MYPAAKENLWGLVLVTTVFAASTLLTMLAIVLASSWGSTAFRSEEWSDSPTRWPADRSVFAARQFSFWDYKDFFLRG